MIIARTRETKTMLDWQSSIEDSSRSINMIMTDTIPELACAE